MKRSMLLVLLLVCGIYLISTFEKGVSSYETYENFFEEPSSELV